MPELQCMAQWYEHLTNIQTDPATSNPGWSPTVHFIIHSMNIRTDSSLCNGASVLEHLYVLSFLYT